MRRLYFLLILTVILGLAACTRTLTGAPLVTEAPTEIVLPTETPAPTETETLAATDTPEPSETATPTEDAEVTPSDTPTQTPTATEPPIDPQALYGNPDLYDDMSDDGNWAEQNGSLPNNDFIRLALGGGYMHVTGKQSGFDTWWFTWPSAGDQYLEMVVETDDCSGKQAYGLILRGPSQGNAARGYILTFSCDGSYRLIRLDSANPYTTVELIPWTEAEQINDGDAENTMGIELLDDRITIYANNFKLAEIEDDTFSSGRFGLFVNAGAPGNFTYSVDELSFWTLD